MEIIKKERLHQINNIDVNYREISDCDNQFEIMKYILNCLSDKQLETTKKLIKTYKQYEQQ